MSSKIIRDIRFNELLGIPLSGVSLAISISFNKKYSNLKPINISDDVLNPHILYKKNGFVVFEYNTYGKRELYVMEDIKLQKIKDKYLLSHDELSNTIKWYIEEIYGIEIRNVIIRSLK